MAATATPYINGMKKPLNMLENPIYPDIKKGPPRFRWSGKFWQVDPGATLRDTEEINQFREDAVLAQARDYNQTVYGQSSFREKVNTVFRPPLLDPIEDFFPLNRIPVTSRAIVPRINPTTIGDGEGMSGYIAKNERISGIESALTDRVKQGEWRPTFYAPVEVPQNNAVLPDLEMTIPSVSASSGFMFPTQNAPTPEVRLDFERFHPSQDTGFTTQVRLDTPSSLEGMQFDFNNPQISATAGMNTPYEINAETNVRELFNNRPQVSASAGMNTPFQANNIETYVGNLEYTRPPVSATAGMNTPYEINGDMSAKEDLNFETHIEAPILVSNPGSEEGFQTRMSMSRDPNEFIHSSRPTYSYVVPPTTTYREQNELTYEPEVHSKLQPLKSYGQISHAGSIKRSGMDVPRKVSMRGAGGWAQTPPIKNYSFGRK